jgi:anaerobic selenocysteine-containing dehydrogenase
VFNGRGRISLHARVGELVPQGVVAARLDWNKFSAARRDGREDAAGGSNVNALTSETLTDLGAGATFYSTLVEVAKV